MTDFALYLKELFTDSGVPAAPEMLEQLDEYRRLLTEWNEKMNLTAITDPEGVAVKHFLDCALALRQVPEAGKIIDVGTGAGFPGLVWAVLRPELQVTLLDSLNKRLLFLEEVCRRLGVRCTLVHARAEEGGRNAALRQSFAAAAARAVAPMNVLAEYCLPFVKQGGCFLALKGPQLDAELAQAQNALRRLGGRLEKVERFQLPGGDQRCLAVIRQTAPVPRQYPRPAAKLKKSPL